ncbi:RHS repeat-associated core domain-containing protein [Leptospira wolffii]|uniref:RHS repeat-associated core domain-containing protein n=1 Tax=Leptospira wolffii TaxID=409998 RepID=UPI002FBE17B6
MSYYPYGEINYTESSGPDIFRYKFTGQIADSETGLYYYKSRYYDPFLGRFIQADDRADQGINGLNRYMYVGGNPVNRIDPDGHSWLSDRLKVKGFFHRAFFVSGARMFDFERSLVTAARIGLALTPLGMLLDPAFTTGFYMASFDFTIGVIVKAAQGKPLPSMSYKHGGFVVRNSLSEEIYSNLDKSEGGAVTFGPFAFAHEGASAATIQHEAGHIRQYNEYGGWGEIGTHVKVGKSVFENQADRRAGTNSYGQNLAYNLLIVLPLSQFLYKKYPDNFLLRYLIGNYIADNLPQIIPTN